MFLIAKHTRRSELNVSYGGTYPILNFITACFNSYLSPFHVQYPKSLSIAAYELDNVLCLFPFHGFQKLRASHPYVSSGDYDFD